MNNRSLQSTALVVSTLAILLSGFSLWGGRHEVTRLAQLQQENDEQRIMEICDNMLNIMEKEHYPMRYPYSAAFPKCYQLSLEGRKAFIDAGIGPEWQHLALCQLAAQSMADLDQCDVLTPTP